MTGASSGLGAEFARQLAARGVPRLMVVARRRDRLELLASELQQLSTKLIVEIEVADLRDASDRARLSGRLAGGEFDVLVNNAGFGTVGAFAAAESARQLAMIQTNLIAPVELIQAALTAFIPARRGLIINVCSTAAFQPMPFMASYGASKAFLFSFGIALACELADSGVQIMTHCPGPTESEFHLAAGLKEKLSHLPATPTSIVIQGVLDAVVRGRTYHVSGLRNRLLGIAVRLLPPPLAARAVAAKLSASAAKLS